MPSNIMYVQRLYLAMCFIGGLFLSACIQQNATDGENVEPNYVLYLLNQDGSNSFLVKDAFLSTGESKTLPVPNANFSREYIQKKGFFYHVNSGNNYLVQYKLDNDNGMVAVDSIELINNYIENFHWKNNTDTLLLFTIDHRSKGKAVMYEIDTKGFELIRKQQLPFSSAIGDFNLLNIGVVDYVDDKLWVAYSYSKLIGKKDYTTSDTMYFATMDFKDFNIQNVQKDTRSTYPGGINTVQTYRSKTAEGDLYFMTCPGIALGNNPKKPTAIFRKLKNSQQVDKNFMINISEKIKNNAYGLWYIGDSKAIIRSEQKDKYTDFSDHHSTYQFEYYLVDLHTGSLKKLDLPLDKGTRKENVLLKDGFVYFGIDDKEGEHRVWQYDIKTAQISPVSTSTASTNYILRIDFLK